MLNKTNILALVGGGSNPKFLPNKVILWDDNQAKMISELRFSIYVKSVKLKQDKIYVICENKIYVFNYITFESIDQINTFQNPKGVYALSINQNMTFLAFPDRSIGYVRVKSYDTPVNTPLINAHDTPIAALSLNNEGSLLATASDKGTVIRIFKVSDGTLGLELRRGSEQAEIYCICFDSTSKFISCSSDRKTVHIFSLSTLRKNMKEEKKCDNYCEVDKYDEEEPKNQKSFLGKITKFLRMPKGYWDSEWSFAQFRISDQKSICCFGPDNTIGVIGLEGKFYQASFDIQYGGECSKMQEFNLDIPNEIEKV